MVDTVGPLRPELKPVDTSAVRERVGGEFGGAPPGAPDVSFKDVLKKSIQEVNALQKEADAAIKEVATGQRDDYAGVISAVQKADIAFKTLMQVRTKLIDAYQEFNRMRV
jgi:flagellar hook-basal body complex protein FliE